MPPTAQNANQQSSVLDDHELLNHRFVQSAVRFGLWKTGAAFSAEDLEQETFLRLIQAIRRDGFSVRSPKAFLSKIAHDTLVDQLRRKRPLQSLGEVPEGRLSYRPPIEKEIDERRYWNRIQAALPRLCPGKRFVIEMYYLHELTVEEIAARLHASCSAIKMKLLRGRRDLARLAGKSRPP